MIASKKLYLALALVILPFVLSGFFPVLSTVGIALNCALLVLLIVDWNLTQSPHLVSTTRNFAERFSIGRDNDVDLSVTNGGANKLHMLVKDDSPPGLAKSIDYFKIDLEPGSTQSLAYTLRPRRRGNYQFGNITIRYLSFFGLFWRQKTFGAQAAVKVYSDLKALYELSIRLAHSTEFGEINRRKRGQGTDFATLREYTIGDDTKAIDWKATARRDRPVVRAYEAEQEQKLLILLDAGRMMVSDLEGLKRFDHALNAALCLVLTGLSSNDQVGLGIFADKPLVYVPPRRGKAHLTRILEATFKAEPVMVEPDYPGMLAHFSKQAGGRSLIVVFSDLTDPSGSKALLAGLGRMSAKHLPFCVTLKDRQVIQVAQGGVQLPDKVEQLHQTFKRAVATDLLHQREIALSVLQKKGCLVLDCPPQELSEKVIQTYLDVKARARL